MQDLSRLLPKNITNAQLAIIQDVLNTVLAVKENMTYVLSVLPDIYIAPKTVIAG